MKTETKGDYVCSSEFNEFREEQKLEHKAIDDKLVKLEPLADLIPSIQELVDDKKAMQKGSKWLMKFLAFVATVLGIVWTIFEIAKSK